MKTRLKSEKRLSASGYVHWRGSRLSRMLCRLRTQEIIDLLRELPAGKYLDIGCAAGDCVNCVAEELPDWKVMGVERSQEIIDSFPCPSERICADARSLPLESESFDVVSLVATLKHIFKPEEAIREIRRVLRPAGRLVIIEPSKFVIQVGCAIGFFDGKNIPNRWSNRECQSFLQPFGFGLLASGHCAIGLYRWCVHKKDSLARQR